MAARIADLAAFCGGLAASFGYAWLRRRAARRTYYPPL